MVGLKQFSVADVLGNALQTFWRQGYRATSVGDLVAATGLSRSSLYAEFESKRGLFLAVWDHYSVGVTEWLYPLETGGRGLADLEEFLDGVVHEIDEAAGPPGCFILNSATELARSDEEVATKAAEYRSRVRTAMHTVLERSAGLGEIGDADIAVRSERLLTAVFGIMVIHATSPGPEDARRAVECLRDEIRRWNS